MTWIVAAILCTNVLLLAYNIRRDRVYEYEYEDEEVWECEYCGTTIYSTTLEGFVEGLRIHGAAIYCPGDEDDDGSYY